MPLYSASASTMPGRATFTRMAPRLSREITEESTMDFVPPFSGVAITSASLNSHNSWSGRYGMSRETSTWGFLVRL